MKRRYILASSLLLIVFSIDAQQSKRSLLYDFASQKRQASAVFAKPEFFKQTENTPTLNATIESVLSTSVSLSLDKDAVISTFQNKPDAVALSIPSGNGQSFVLQLAKQEINTDGGFSFGTINNHIRHKRTTDQGLHYRGYIDGDPSSMATFSIFANGDIMGLFANKEGNFTIGKIKNTTKDYILYNSKNFRNPPGSACATDDSFTDTNEPPFNASAVTQNDAPPTLCRKVRLYWEGSYDLYDYNFGANLDDVQNYLTGLFNEVAAMYQNEGIIVELAEAYVWDSPDPYRTSSSGDALTDFKSYWNSADNLFNGDLAHLIAGGPTNNGGVAYLTSNFCTRTNAFAYSNVDGFYLPIPIYSWDVEVVTHETGHNFGSHHTHWCGWNTGAGGTCGAIDNCYTLESGSGCTTCTPQTNANNPPPGWQGTVMSYCHLKNGIGIDLANGFGPLPQATIRSYISARTCLSSSTSWSGTVSTAWENAANWSCGSVPDIKTDVTIPNGVPNYPVVNSAAVCRSLKQDPGTSVIVNPGRTINVAGPPVP